MSNVKLKNGHVASHSHSDRMVELATKWLREYFSDGIARRPGDFEDDFTGRWSIDLSPWRKTPFYPALATLVDAEEIVYGMDGEGDYWYATPGNLPIGVDALK